MVLRDSWDWSHACMSVIYGTGPMLASQVQMGPVPRYILIKLWEFEKLQEQLSIMKSHRCLKSIYGTGPIGISQPDMGLHAYIFIMKSHNYLRTIYGTSPMYSSQTHMGPVPYVFLRYPWDQSHRWFSDRYGTPS